MLNLRRASAISIRAQRLCSGATRAFGALRSAGGCGEENLIYSHSLKFTSGLWCTSSRFHHSSGIVGQFSIGSRSLSSQAGAKSGGEEEIESDAFSELEEPEASETLQNSNSGDKDELLSEIEFEDNDDEGGEGIDKEVISTTESDSGDAPIGNKRFYSPLFPAIMAERSSSIYKVLDNYVADGKELLRDEISNVMLELRKRNLYTKALQFYEWLETKKHIEFLERDYASGLDLIGKVRGLQKAENYIQSIPEELRGEVVYRTLLANCVSATNVKKAEEIFNKMKELNFPVTAFACNQLLLLYKRVDRKKIANVLLFMEKENVKPTLFTYRILIDSKGLSNDMDGMDKIVETMKAEGVEPDMKTQALLARHYAVGGLKERAEEVLKGIEGSDLQLNRAACHFLLPIYAELGNADDVGRVWDVCKKKPTQADCVAAIEAWGKLKKIEEAEAVFEQMTQTWKKVGSRQYAVLLRVYANHKMLSKGKDLVRRMAESGCHVGPIPWDALIKLYVRAGEVEKADAILHKVIQQNRGKPLFTSFMAIMDQYAKKGDIHNSEKIFQNMKPFGYGSRPRPFQALLQTYINAKAPAYGFRERMKAENIFPNKVIAGQLAQVDAFKKSVVSDLLD